MHLEKCWLQMICLEKSVLVQISVSAEYSAADFPRIVVPAPSFQSANKILRMSLLSLSPSALNVDSLCVSMFGGLT